MIREKHLLDHEVPARILFKSCLKFMPKNIDGILTCYTLALPFFGNTLAGSLFYSAAMFGGYELLKRNIAQSAPESLLK